MKILWDSPWWVSAACLLAGAAAAALLYRRSLSEVPQWAGRVLVALRFLTVTLCCLLLTAILLRQVHNESQRPLVVVATDMSASMVAARDSAWVRANLAGELNALAAKLGSQYEVANLFFSSGVATDPPAQKWTGRETDLGDLLRNVSNNYANQNVGALVVVSDGIYNRGSNPVYAAGRLGFPVFAVGTGDTVERPDVLVRRVDHNEIAYLGNDFPVVVQVAAKKADGRTVRVELLHEGKVKGAQTLKITSRNFSEPVTFTLNAASPGVQHFEARITGAGDEHNARNNFRRFVVEVLDNKEKILLLAQAPHPDVGAIRDAIAGNTSYALTFGDLNQPLPQLNQFHLVIVHGYNRQAAEAIRACHAAKVPYWIVNPATSDNLPGVQVVTGLNRFNEVEPYIDRTFTYFSLSPELERLLGELPAVSAFFGNYNLPQGSSPLLLQRLGPVETANPILFFNAAGDTRFGVFIGEGLWKWKLREFAMYGNSRRFAELVSKCVQYLAAREDKSFFRLRVPAVASDNESLELDAELYNKSYQPVNTPEVTIIFRNAADKQYNFTFSRTAQAYHLNAGTLPAGDYRYRATVAFGGDTYTREGRVTVRETDVEQVNTVADHELLRQLAQRSGGGFFKAGELERLGKELMEGNPLKTVVYSQTVTSPLIDEAALFYVLLALLAAEWYLRKRYLVI